MYSVKERIGLAVFWAWMIATFATSMYPATTFAYIMRWSNTVLATVAMVSITYMIMKIVLFGGQPLTKDN
jgi:hypothetical protein